MIQIGVFAHEFGHAFGLPDLYDTDDDNGDSEGIGNWGLMAGGSWGGDGASPETPSHMSAWSKEFLGWINPTVVGGDQTPATIKNVEENDKSYKIAVDSNEYYLVSNRQKKGFDANLPQSGLLIWHINQAVVNAGLPNNRVNSDENSKGVDLEGADGNNDLDNTTNRGDAGDIFPGSSDKRKFDKTTSPSSSGSVAVCEISNSADSMTANLHVTTNTCPDDGDDDDNCSSLLLPRAPRAGKQTLLLWCLLLLPVVVAGWMADRPRLGQHTARGKR